MRLGQLARKLAIKPSELVDFLTTKGISTESGINTRLEPDQVQFIVKALAPEKLAEVMAEPVVPEEPEVVVIEPKSVLEEVTVVAEPEPGIVMDEIPTLPVQQTEQKELTVEKEEGETEVEIIKVPKIELQGLKVLGKIELPEAKKKEPVVDAPANAEFSEPDTITGNSVKSTQPSARRNQPPQRRERVERTEQRSGKNPIALKREQEALEAERKRKERAELEKEKRTQNYLKRVKSAPTKAVKRVDEEQVTEEMEEEVKAPTTWIGNFFRWFKS